MGGKKILLPVFIILLLVILVEVAYILFYSNKDHTNILNSPPLTLEPTKVQKKSTKKTLIDPMFESMIENGIVKFSYLTYKIETKLISIERKNNPESLFLTIKNGDGKLTYLYKKSQFDKITVFNNNKRISFEDLKPGDDIEMIFEFDMLYPESDIRSLKITKL